MNAVNDSLVFFCVPETGYIGRRSWTPSHGLTPGWIKELLLTGAPACSLRFIEITSSWCTFLCQDENNSLSIIFWIFTIPSDFPTSCPFFVNVKFIKCSSKSTHLDCAIHSLQVFWLEHWFRQSGFKSPILHLFNSVPLRNLRFKSLSIPTLKWNKKNTYLLGGVMRAEYIGM